MLSKREFVQPINEKLGPQSDYESALIQDLRKKLTEIENAESPENDAENHNNNQITLDEINGIRTLAASTMGVVTQPGYQKNTPNDHNQEIGVFLDTYLTEVQQKIAPTPVNVAPVEAPEMPLSLNEDFLNELTQSPDKWFELCKNKNLIADMFNGQKIQTWNQFYPEGLKKLINQNIFNENLNRSYAILFLVLQIYRQQCPQDGILYSAINAVSNVMNLTYSTDYKKSSIEFVQQELIRMRGAQVPLTRIGEELFLTTRPEPEVPYAKPSEKPEEKIKAAMQDGSRCREFMNTVLQQSSIKTLEEALKIQEQRVLQKQSEYTASVAI